MIKMEIGGISEVMRKFDGQNVAKGLKVGLKKVGNGVRSLADRTARGTYNVKKRDFDGTFVVSERSNSVLITSIGRPINLTYFGAKQFGKRGGKRVTIKRNKDQITKSVRGRAGTFGGVTVPITSAKTTLLQGAFIAKVKAGSKGAFNIGVFMRAGYAAKNQYQDPRNRRSTSRPYVKVVRAKTPKQREAIINKAFVSVPTLFGGKKVTPAIKAYLETDALRTLEHEMTWSLKGKGR